MKILIALMLLQFCFPLQAAISADSLISSMEKNVRGTSFSANIEMSIIKPNVHRQLAMKVWTKGRDKALVKVLSPAKDRGTGNLRLKLELWQYLPNIEKIVRIPPSLMLQSWMGSNFTNDDLVKMSSLDTDYTHKMISEEQIDGSKVAKIECLAKPDAPVVWGKTLVWISLDKAALLKEEFYTEHGKLVKTLVGRDVRTFGSHHIPTQLVMTDAGAEKSETSIDYKDVKFDQDLSDSLFTQQNLKVAP